MDEFIYACFAFDADVSADVADAVSAVATSYADDGPVSLTDGSPDPEVPDDAARPVSFRVGDIEYELGIGAPEMVDLDDERTVWIRVFGTNFHAPTAGTEAASEHTDTLVSLVAATYEALVDGGCPVSCVYGFGPTEVQMLLNGAVEIPDEQLAGSGVEALFWLQILPPARVSAVGRDRLLSSPAWRVEELSDGGVLLVVYDTPDPWVDGDSSLLTDVMAHLDMEDPHEG